MALRHALINLCLFAVGALLFFGRAEAAETRVALVIGNSAYQHTTSLKNPAKDAVALKAALERLGFSVVEGHDLTRASFEEKLRDFAGRVRGAEMALLFYAGHGLQVDGENWLIPVDSDVRSEMDLELGAISLSTVVKSMESGALVRLIFLDACRNNPMTTQLAQGQGSRTVSVGRGLARVEAGIGTLIAYSTQPGAVAADGSGSHSPFASALLEVIQSPGLEVRQILTRVRAKVIAETNEAQVPWDHSSLIGDVFLSSPAPITQIAAVSPSTTALPPIKSSKNPACRRAQERIDALSYWARNFDQAALTRDAEACLESGDADAWGYYLRGSARWFDLQQQGAAEDFAKAIALRPDFADFYLGRALMLLDENNFEKARADLDLALKLEPDNAKAHGYLGDVFQLQGDFDKALKTYDRATSIDPSLIAPYAGRAVIFLHREEWRRVIAELDKAAALNSQAVFVYVGRARAYLNTGDRASAEASLQQALKLDPDEAGIYTVRATLHFNAKDVDRALADFQKALSLDPKSYEALGGRARCLIEKGHHRGALADLNAMAKMRQDDPAVFHWRGRLLLEQGDTEEAIADFDRALALKPANEAMVLYERALALVKVDRRPEAIGDLKRAQMLMPDRPEIKSALKDLGVE